MNIFQFLTMGNALLFIAFLLLGLINYLTKSPHDIGVTFWEHLLSILDQKGRDTFLKFPSSLKWKFILLRAQKSIAFVRKGAIVYCVACMIGLIQIFVGNFYSTNLTLQYLCVALIPISVLGMAIALDGTNAQPRIVGPEFVIGPKEIGVMVVNFVMSFGLVFTAIRI